MKKAKLTKRIFGLFAGICMAVPFGAAAAQGWHPDSNVEIIVGSSPGGSFDITARNMKRIFEDTKMVDASISVLNKPGGNNAVSWAYLNQHTGNGNYLALAFPTIITNKLMGRNPLTYTDMTPIAHLYSDYIAFGVKKGSPLKTAKDIAAAIKKDPKSITFGLTAVGTAHQIAAASLAKAAGVDPKQLKFVVFKGAGNAVAAVLGGHIDVVISSPASLTRHNEAGNLLVPLVTSSQRLTGALANVPTLKEQGFNLVVTNWRGMVGPKNLGKAEVAYWEQVFEKLSKNQQWIDLMKKYGWGNDYMNHREFTKFLEEQTQELRETFANLGLLK